MGGRGEEGRWAGRGRWHAVVRAGAAFYRHRGRKVGGRAVGGVRPEGEAGGWRHARPWWRVKARQRRRVKARRGRRGIGGVGRHEDDRRGSGSVGAVRAVAAASAADRSRQLPARGGRLAAGTRSPHARQWTARTTRLPRWRQAPGRPHARQWRARAARDLPRAVGACMRAAKTAKQLMHDGTAVRADFFLKKHALTAANCSARLAPSRLPSGSARPAAAYTRARGGIAADARGQFFLLMTIMPLAAKGYG